MTSVDHPTMARSDSTLEASRSELKVGDRTHPVAHSAGNRLSRKASDDDLLESYLDFVRSLRNQHAGNVWLRTRDVEVLATVLGRTPEAVQADLEGRMTVHRLEQTRRHAKRRRAAFSAFGIAVVSSALVISAPGRASSNEAAGAAGSVRIGSALTIERRADNSVVTIESGSADSGSADGTTSSTDVQVGAAQTITRG
jgi:hypothetical protein